MKLGPDGSARNDVERVLKGQIKKREGNYKNDLLEGPVKEYDEKGRLISTVVYSNGVAALKTRSAGSRSSSTATMSASRSQNHACCWRE